MNSLRFMHLLLGQAAMVAGLIGAAPFFIQSGPIDLTALLVLFFGLLNLQRFGSLRGSARGSRGILSIVASILLLVATLAPLTAFLITPRSKRSGGVRGGPGRGSRLPFYRHRYH